MPKFSLIGTIGTVVATVALVAAVMAFTIAASARSNSAGVICAQIEHLRSNLVSVLDAAELGSVQQVSKSHRPPRERQRMLEAIHKFYAQQRDLIGGPKSCP